MFFSINVFLKIQRKGEYEENTKIVKSILNCDYLCKMIMYLGRKGWEFKVCVPDEEGFVSLKQPWVACAIKKTLLPGNRNSCCAVILSPTERVLSHSASSSDCRRESVLKGPGPPFLRCQVTPPVALVVIVSTRNHAMINAYLHEWDGGSAILTESILFDEPTGRDLSKASKVYRRDSVRDDDAMIESLCARTRRAWLPVEIVFYEIEIIVRNERTFNWCGSLWRNRSIYSTTISTSWRGKRSWSFTFFLYVYFRLSQSDVKITMFF